MAKARRAGGRPASPRSRAAKPAAKQSAKPAKPAAKPAKVPDKPGAKPSKAEVAAAVEAMKNKKRGVLTKEQQAEARKKAKERWRELEREIGTAVRADKIDEAVALIEQAAKLATTKTLRRSLQLWCQGHGNRDLWAQKWAQAAALYDAGIAVARDTDDSDVTAAMLAESGFAWLQIHELDEAEKRIQRALELHDLAKRDEAAANAVYYLSSVIFERGQIVKAVELAREAVKRSEDAGDPRGATFHAYALARGLYEQGHTREAEEVSKKAIERAQALGLTAVEGNLLNMIANVALDDHRLEEGKRHYERALELFSAAGLKNHQAITTSNLGNLAWDEDRLEDALHHYADAIELHDTVKDSRSIAIGLTARAGVLTELGRFAEAETDLHTALGVMMHKGHERRVSFVRAAFARLAEARGALEEARAHYAEAEISLEAAGDDVEIGRMLYAAAGVEAELGDPESAEALIVRAAALDPASLSDKSGVGEKRAGMHATRALSSLAQARIEVARAKQRGGDEGRALRMAATARLQAVVSGKDSLMARSSEVRRVVARLAAQLATDAAVVPAMMFAGSSDSSWGTELTGELVISSERGELVATGKLTWGAQTGGFVLRGPDAGVPRVLRGKLVTTATSANPAEQWALRLELDQLDRVLRGRLIHMLGDGEDEVCRVAWRRTDAAAAIHDRFGVFRGKAGALDGELDVRLENDEIVIRGRLDSSTHDGSVWLHGPDTGELCLLEGTRVTLPSGRDNQPPQTTAIRAELLLLGSSLQGDIHEVVSTGDVPLCTLDFPRAKS